MFGLHPLSRHAVRLGIAVGSLAAVACGDNTISGPTLDVNLSRVAGFDNLKAALVKLRHTVQLRAKIDASWMTLNSHLGWFAAAGIWSARMICYARFGRTRS